MTRTSIDGVSAIEIVGNKRYRVADDALRRIPATIHLDLVENRPQPHSGYTVHRVRRLPSWRPPSPSVELYSWSSARRHADRRVGQAPHRLTVGTM